jgi:hypothetical protein
MFRALTRLLRRGSVDPAQLPLPLVGAPAPAPGEPPWQRVVVPRPHPVDAPLADRATPALPPTPRRRRSAAEQDEIAAAKLTVHHAQLNAERFGGALRGIRIVLSRRLRSRLGYYRIATPREAGSIAISRRHLRRHGWDEAIETLLHEMVHQWQDENGLPVDHGAQFRAKARAVGCIPRARRRVG